MVKDKTTKIFKALPVSFYMAFLRFLSKLLLRSYPIQKIVAIAAILSHKWGEFCNYLSTLFDEEAPMHNRLKATSHRMEIYRDSWLHMSRTPVDMSFDFALRRWIFRVIAFIVKWTILTVMKCKSSISSLVNTKKDTPYDFWQKSLHKSDIKCLLDTGGDDFQSVGEFRMDLEAPCEVRIPFHNFTIRYLNFLFIR